MRTFVFALTLFLSSLPRAQSIADFQAAEAARRANDLPAAIAAYERIVALNPYHGGHWYSLATACYESKSYKRGAEAYIEAYRLGQLRDASAYNVACCFALDGKPGPALEWLEKAIVAGYRNFENIQTDADLVSIRTNPRFKALLPTGFAEFPNRAAGWTADLDFLQSTLMRVHYNLAVRPDRTQIETGIARLKGEIDRLTDQQIVMRMAKIVASVGDGHTRLGMSMVTKGFHRYPLMLEQFKDGIAVGMAKPELKEFLGKRLLRIDGVPVEQVFEKLSPYVSKDNPMGDRANVPILMCVPELLVEEGISKKVEEAVFEFEGLGKRTLKSDPYASENGWINLSSIEPGENPLYLRNPSDAYWFEVLPESKSMYMQYNAVVNKPQESFLNFCLRMFKEIEDRQLERLIIDLRWNGGGNNGLIWPLVYGIIRRPRINNTGQIFVITGRHTFSAAQNCATNLDLHTQALFVGEPTGSKPNHIGETTTFLLPYSRLRGSISRLLWQDSSPNDTRIWIAPDIVAERTVEDVRLHRDAALAAILRRG